MVEIEFERFSQGPKEERRGPRGIRITTSEVDVICGLSKHASPTSLWDYIVTLGEPEREDTPQMRHGRTTEEFSANLYTNLTGWEVAPGNFHYPDDPQYADRFGCSPDRKVVTTVKEDEEMTDEGSPTKSQKETKIWEGILDIHNRCYDLGQPGVTPGDMAKIQFQLFITKKEWCDYLVTWFEFEEDATADKLKGVRMTRVYKSEKYLEWLLPQLMEFSECLETQMRPVPLGDRTPTRPPLVKTVEYQFE